MQRTMNIVSRRARVPGEYKKKVSSDVKEIREGEVGKIRREHSAYVTLSKLMLNLKEVKSKKIS